MVERKNRRWGSMKNAKQIKLQVTDDTLIFLEHRSYVNNRSQVGYGKAIDDLCHDFQSILKEHAQLLYNYKQLLERYSAVLGSHERSVINRSTKGLNLMSG